MKETPEVHSTEHITVLDWTQLQLRYDHRICTTTGLVLSTQQSVSKTDDLFNTTTWLLQPVLYCPNWIGACIKQGYFYSHGNQVTWLTLTTPCPIWWRQWMFSKNPSTQLERTFETSMKLPSFSSFHHWCRWMFALKNCSLSKLIKKDDRCACQEK